jgi:Tfp pilus assembly protein PilO
VSRVVGVHQPFWRRNLLRPFLVLLVVNVLVFGLYTLPRRTSEKSASEQLVALRAEAESERQTISQLRAETETYHANLRDTQRFYADVLGGRQSLVEVLEELGRMAAELGLRPGRRSFTQEEVEGVPLLKFGIKMPVSGSYSQLVSLLDRLERTPRFVTVESLRLRGKTGEQQADLDLVLSAYFRGRGGSGQ